MAKVSGDNFTSALVPIRTETPILMWVIDDKMNNGVTSVVCATIKINGQTINVGTTLYGQATFILGNDGIIR
jgi:spore coat protein CotH